MCVHVCARSKVLARLGQVGTSRDVGVPGPVRQVSVVTVFTHLVRLVP